MTNPDAITDLHEAKIKTITMEAPEGYEFGHVISAQIEMRVSQLGYKTNKEGEMIRTATMVIEQCHIKDAYDPAKGPGTTAATTLPDPGETMTDPGDGEPVDVAETEDVDSDAALDEVPF